MSPAEADQISEILARVKNWSTLSRRVLALRILESLDQAGIGGIGDESPTKKPIRGVPVDSVVGFLKTDREPPSDEECDQILEDELWKKYGS